jgi:hypothetical protein
VHYVRPYLGVLMLAVLLSAVYAGARTARALLIQPVFVEILTPHQQAGERISVRELAGPIFERGAAQPEASPAPEPELDGDAL